MCVLRWGVHHPKGQIAHLTSGSCQQHPTSKEGYVGFSLIREKRKTMGTEFVKNELKKKSKRKLEIAACCSQVG